MTDNIIKVSVKTSKPKSVTVKTSNIANEITASPDTSQYYANKSKNWAIAENLVDNTDYSSKYYANKSKTSAANAKNYADAAQNIYTNFNSESSASIIELRGIKDNAIAEINQKSVETVDELNNALNSSIVDGEKEISASVTEGKVEINGLIDEIRSEAENIINRVGFNLFDTKLTDHILEGEEAFGWALQGTYTLSSYTDFYAKCLAEKNAGVETQTTLGENTITTYNNANGHIYYDIADKDAVDAYYNETGAAWYYGIDTENQRIFLPRNDWFEQAASSGAGEFTEAGLPNITGVINAQPNYHNGRFAFVANGCFTPSTVNQASFNTSVSNDIGNTAMFDASLSDSIYGNANTVQPASVKKLLYICVGNTMVNESEVNVAKLTTDVQNLESNKASISDVPALAAPSSRHESLTIGASGTNYTAPAAGYFTMNAAKPNAGQVIFECQSKHIGSSRYVPAGGSFVVASSLVQAGDVVTLAYDGTIDTSITGAGFWFVYAEGSKEVV